MSKIEKELAKATGLEQDKGEKRPTWLARLLKAVGKLADKDWEGLSEKAQDWYNGNADARNAAKKADKDLPDCTEFPDLEKQEEEAPAKRRRSSDDDGDDAGSKDSGSLAVGVRAKITTKKGKTYEGEVTELDDEIVVLKKADGEEVEIDLAKIESKEVFHGTASSKGGKKASKDEEPVDPLAKGNVVEIETKRGKKVTGKIVSIDDDEIVIETDDGEEEFRRDRVESIKPVGGAKKAKPAAEEDEPPAKRSSKKEDDEPAPKGKGKESDEKAPRAKNAEGVSVSAVITELIVDDMEADEEAIAKALKKKGVECKENTLHLNYVSTHKVLAVLKEKKKLKA